MMYYYITCNKQITNKKTYVSLLATGEADTLDEFDFSSFSFSTFGCVVFASLWWPSVVISAVSMT